MDNYAYRLEFAVRDYELDMQGIVNNAVYQNYLEHTRHEFLKTVGINFAEYTQEKIHLVVIRAELDYKSSLQSGDRFWVGVSMQKESLLKFAFLQGIYRLPDNRPVLKAKIIGTALNEHGRPTVSPELDKALSQLIVGE